MKRKKLQFASYSIGNCILFNFFHEFFFSKFATPRRDKELEKILIIDDEYAIRIILKRYLTKTYSVYVAGNLKEAYELNNKVSPDIIIMDVNLPDGNGAEHIAQFKNNKNTIILISADQEQLKHSNLQANDFLIKPFTQGVLLGHIKKNREKITSINK